MIGTVLKILGGGLVEQVGKVIDNLHTSDEEKAEAKQKVMDSVLAHQTEIEKTIQTEMQAKERVIVAEMQSGDNFTRRCRPMVVYAGLACIIINHVVAPWASHFAGLDVPSITLPEEFWWAWTGVTSVWFIGRSTEKRGTTNKLVEMLMGAKD